MKEYFEPEWSQVNDQLDKLDLEYGDKDNKSLEDEDGESLEEENELYCVACDKSFKSEKSFQNHEGSKKHKKNVELLKQHMKDEDFW